MIKPTFDDIRDLLTNLIFPFYEIERDLPLPIQNHRNETDAEHSWSLAAVAILLAPEVDKSLDTGKCAIFAIVHDLVEVYAGDVSVWASKEKLSQKPAKEKQALNKIESKYKAFPSLAKYIKEYESKKSNEALFIYALDKFVAMLTLFIDEGHYYKLNKLTKERWLKVATKHREKARSHPEIGKYYDELWELAMSKLELFFSK